LLNNAIHQIQISENVHLFRFDRLWLPVPEPKEGLTMVEPSTLMQRIFQRAEEMALAQNLPGLAGLSDARLHAIHSGGPLTSTEFELICQALAVDSGAMYGGRSTSSSRSPARFRAATAVETPNPMDVRLLALGAEQGRILGHLMTLMRKEIRLQQHKHAIGVQGGELWRGGYELGEAARAELAPDNGPLHDLPRLLNDAGVHVARVHFGSENIDAASVWEPTAAPLVLVNANSRALQHPGAFRASLAHEVCHLLHDAGERDLSTNVSWGVEGTGSYHVALEMRARAFAPAFLAPKGSVLAWRQNLPPRFKKTSTTMVNALAETWGLSFEGAAWHAKNCGLIEPAEANRLAGMPKKPQISLADFETQIDFYPPAMVHPELPEEPAPLWQGWASFLVLEAVEEGHISIGRARELLTWG